LLARIHRATLQRLRAEIQPITPADFMRFLLEWQHVSPSGRLRGLEGVRVVINQLDGFELAADAWDRYVLPSRVADYDPSMLDLLCYSGETAWARVTHPPPVAESALLPPRPVRATPVALFVRDHGRAWRAIAAVDRSTAAVSDTGAAVLRVLERGAQFVHGIAETVSLPVEDVRVALSELVWAGLVTSDGFAGLRAMYSGTDFSRPSASSRSSVGYGATAARANSGGRWARIEADTADRESALDLYAQTLLQRYGIVCRRLLAREPYGIRWRELLPIYRRLEARGDLRGGRFVSGLPGEQFALPDAVAMAREIRRRKRDGETITISAADPLNLVGIITAGERTPAVAATPITYRDGVPAGDGAAAVALRA
jgi:ATP-dependent Lhr-like helicase